MCSDGLSPGTFFMSFRPSCPSPLAFRRASYQVGSSRGRTGLSAARRSYALRSLNPEELPCRAGICILDWTPLVGWLSRSLDWKEQEERKGMKNCNCNFNFSSDAAGRADEGATATATAFLVGVARETRRRDANQGCCP